MSSGDSEYEEELGRHLDEHLQSHRDGEPEDSLSEPDAIADLKRVIDRLNDLSKVASSDELVDDFPQRIGKYEILRCVGRGGQSYAFLAFDPDLLRDVVLKFYHQTSGKPVLESILREARTLTRVNSPRVVECYAVNHVDDVPYLVLESVRGTVLSELNKTQPWDHRQCATLMMQVAEGLADVHDVGLLHRDVKPQNIVVDHDGFPKLIDFGLVAECGDGCSGGGTPQYMSPEHALGHWEKIDQRTDIFGVGAILYELLSGRKIYGDGEKDEILRRARQAEIIPLGDISAHVPKELRDLCMACLAAEPSQRPASARLLATELRRFAGKNSRRRTWWCAAIATVVTFAMALSWSFDWFRPATLETTTSEIQSEEAPKAAGKWSKIYEAFSQESIPTNKQLGLRDDFAVDFDLIGTPIRAAKRIVVPEDEVLQFSVRPEKACYVAIYSVEFADAESLSAIVRLFPQHAHEDNYVPEGETLVVPPVSAERAFDLELLYIVASTSRMRLQTHTNRDELATFDSEDQRQAWAKRLRGFRRTGELSERMIPYQILPE